MKAVASTIAMTAAVLLGGAAAYWSHLPAATVGSQPATQENAPAAQERQQAPVAETDFATLTVPATAVAQQAADAPRRERPTAPRAAQPMPGQPVNLGSNDDQIDQPQQFIGQINLGDYVDPLAVDRSLEGFINLGSSETTDP